MRIRRDLVFISSVLFTLSMFYLTPICLRAALAGHDKTTFETLDAGYQAAAQTMSDLGIADIAVICVAMIVIWTGYLRKVRERTSSTY